MDPFLLRTHSTTYYKTRRKKKKVFFLKETQIQVQRCSLSLQQLTYPLPKLYESKPYYNYQDLRVSSPH